MKKQKNTTVRTAPKSVRGRNDTTNTNTWQLTFFAWYAHFNKKKILKVVLWVKYFLYESLQYFFYP